MRYEECHEKGDGNMRYKYYQWKWDGKIGDTGKCYQGNWV